MRGEGSDTHMDKPCEICGGVGFEYCIVNCSQCCTTREHIYCMKKNLIEVPDVWICEACTPTSNVVSPKSGGEEEGLDLFGIVHHEIMHPGTPGKVCADPRRQVDSKKLKMERGKVKYLPTEEAIKLSSRTLKIKFSGRDNTGLKCGPSNSIETMSRKTSIPSKIVTPKFSSPVVEENPNVTSAFMKPPTYVGGEINKMLSQHTIQTSNESKALNQRCDENCAEEYGGKEWPGTILLSAKETSEEKSKEFKAANASTEMTMYGAFTTAMHSAHFKEVEASNRKIEKAEDSTSQLTVSPITSSGKTFHITAEPADLAVEERDFLNLLSKVELYRIYRPALEVIWVGGFKIFDTDSVGSFYGGFLVQPPRKGHSKALEFSKKLPKILQVKLLPRAHLSADLFGNDGPDFDDIALYFFPSTNIERSNWNNSHLFEILEIQNSVMSCYVDGVELLIFTSKQLHVDSQRVIARLDSKYFLWGVFRDVKADHILHESHEEPHSLVSISKCVCDDHANMDNLEATDMDIDMEGGRMVGPVDTVVSKESSRRACKSHDKEDATFVKKDMLLEPKRGRCTSSNLFTKSSEEIKCKISSEHILSNGNLVNAKVDADCPPCLRNTPRLNFRTIEEKAGGVDGGLQGLSGPSFGASSPELERSLEDSKFTKSEHPQERGRDEAYDPFTSFSSPLSERGNQRGLEIKAEVNVGLQGISGAAFGASSPQLQRSLEDSKITKSQHPQEHGRDEPYDPFAAFSTPLSERGNQRVLEIKAEVNDDVDPLRRWKKKDMEADAKRIINVSFCWMPPPKNWVKLNIEGSSNGILGSAGAGGTLRDESGKWILGYSKNLGTSTSLISELWALFLGLKLVFERGFRKVLVEFESYKALKCLRQPTAFLDPNRALIESCREYLHKNWDCKFQWVSREGNLCANWLATHCGDQSLGILAVFDTPPHALVPIFQKDCTGIVNTHSH